MNTPNDETEENVEDNNYKESDEEIYSTKSEKKDTSERHGLRKVSYLNGDVYSGNYYQGFRHGSGIYVFVSGARYDGDWQRGIKEGKGTFWYPDGSHYEGEWKNNLKHGFGVYHYPNGDIYLGTWKNNLKDGRGTYEFKDFQVKFIGNWRDDQMMGPGQMIYPYYRFYGCWNNNLPSSRGCFVFENNLMQHGIVYHKKISNLNEIDCKKSDKPYSKAYNVDNGEDKANDSNTGFSLEWNAQLISPYNPDLLPCDVGIPLDSGNDEISSESTY